MLTKRGGYFFSHQEQSDCVFEVIPTFKQTNSILNVEHFLDASNQKKFLHNLGKKENDEKESYYKNLVSRIKKIRDHLIFTKFTACQQILDDNFTKIEIEKHYDSIHSLSVKINELKQFLAQVNVLYYDESSSEKNNFASCENKALQATQFFKPGKCYNVDKRWLNRIVTGSGSDSEKATVVDLLFDEMEQDPDFKKMTHLILNHLENFGIHVDRIEEIIEQSDRLALYLPSQQRVVVSLSFTLDRVLRFQLRHELRHAFWHLIQRNFDSHAFSVECWHPLDSQSRELVRHLITLGDVRINSLDMEKVNNLVERQAIQDIKLQISNFEPAYPYNQRPYEREAKLYAEVSKEILSKYYPELLGYTDNLVKEKLITLTPPLPNETPQATRTLNQLLEAEHLALMSSPYYYGPDHAGYLLSVTKKYYKRGEKYFDACLKGYDKLLQSDQFIGQAHLGIAAIAMHRANFALALTHYQKAIESNLRLSEEEEKNYKRCLLSLESSLMSTFKL